MIATAEKRQVAKKIRRSPPNQELNYEIYRDYAFKEMTVPEIARKYGKSTHQIHEILKREYDSAMYHNDDPFWVALPRKTMRAVKRALPDATKHDIAEMGSLKLLEIRGVGLIGVKKIAELLVEHGVIDDAREWIRGGASGRKV